MIQRNALERVPVSFYRRRVWPAFWYFYISTALCQKYEDLYGQRYCQKDHRNSENHTWKVRARNSIHVRRFFQARTRHSNEISAVHIEGRNEGQSDGGICAGETVCPQKSLCQNRSTAPVGRLSRPFRCHRVEWSV